MVSKETSFSQKFTSVVFLVNATHTVNIVLFLFCGSLVNSEEMICHGGVIGLISYRAWEFFFFSRKSCFTRTKLTPDTEGLMKDVSGCIVGSVGSCFVVVVTTIITSNNYIMDCLIDEKS